MLSTDINPIKFYFVSHTACAEREDLTWRGLMISLNRFYSCDDSFIFNVAFTEEFSGNLIIGYSSRTMKIFVIFDTKFNQSVYSRFLLYIHTFTCRCRCR